MYTNSTNIPLSIAVWLITDNYDHIQDPNYISATSLLKPIRSIVLERSIPITTTQDIANLVPSKIGTAVHDSIENAWKTKAEKALKALGYPKDLCESIIINPDPKSLIDGQSPIYLEIRTKKKVGKYTIGGKFDFVIAGELTDFKTTKTYNWISGSNKDTYIKQGSIYRWLNPDIITSDILNIGYIFTDWIAMKALQDKSYPQQNIIEQKYPLMTTEATETFIKSILNQIDHYKNKPQSELPLCTKEELWQRDSVWKYYKDPTKRTRSTKNFDNSTDAHQHNSINGNIGIVVEVPGEVKRCTYCNAKSVCLQAENLEALGLLK